MDNFAANLKEVNDLIDADIEYKKEMEISNLAMNTCSECKHSDAWHSAEGCTYRVEDGLSCDCDETEIEFK